MVKAMKTKVGNPLRKLVLIKLADNASDTGECWPSFKHIADQCEISRRSVISHIDALCEMGMLIKEHRPGHKGNSSNLYHLSITGAGFSLGGGAGVAPGGAGDSLGGGAGDAPRISHSFESVNESSPQPPEGEGLADDENQKPQRRKPAAKIDYEGCLNAYNEEVGDRLPHALVMNKNRKRKLKEIIGLLKTPNVDGFRAYVRAFVANAKPFYFGNNDRGWIADFDYLLREDVLTSVREGKISDFREVGE